MAGAQAPDPAPPLPPPLGARETRAPRPECGACAPVRRAGRTVNPFLPGRPLPQPRRPARTTPTADPGPPPRAPHSQGLGPAPPRLFPPAAFSPPPGGPGWHREGRMGRGCLLGPGPSAAPLRAAL